MWHFVGHIVNAKLLFYIAFMISVCSAVLIDSLLCGAQMLQCSDSLLLTDEGRCNKVF